MALFFWFDLIPLQRLGYATAKCVAVSLQVGPPRERWEKRGGFVVRETRYTQVWVGGGGRDKASLFLEGSQASTLVLLASLV